MCPLHEEDVRRGLAMLGSRVVSLSQVAFCDNTEVCDLCRPSVWTRLLTDNVPCLDRPAVLE